MFYISGIQGNQTLYIPPQTQDRATAVSPVGAAKSVIETPSHGQQSPSQQHVPFNPYARLDEPTPKREAAILASQIMTTSVITLGIKNTVEQARKIFHEKTIRHIPIISEDGKVVGIVSDRDFLTLNLDHSGIELSKAQQLSTPLKDIMTKNVLTARPNAEIRIIAKVMFVENISAMPLVNDQELLVGILTTNDILRTLVNKAPLELWT